jgi:mannose/cellobiose epimerase-like protein (N-acyl-D-glucosamine 2-epimerase family)
MAVRYGLDRDRGRIVDEMDEAGRIRSTSSRAWPHAEALKALAAEAARGDAQSLDAVAPILRRLCDVHCRAELGGGWVDHVDADDLPISRVMPASTLYHVYFGVTAAAALVQAHDGALA